METIVGIWHPLMQQQSLCGTKSKIIVEHEWPSVSNTSLEWGSSQNSEVMMMNIISEIAK